MRRAVTLLLAIVAAVPAGPARADDGPLPFLPRACTPEIPSDQERPAGCQRIRYRLGPIHITPGDNLILFGPISIERPVGEGFIARFKPDMTTADGTVPPIEVIHLHHAVWFIGGVTPTFASGEEKTIFSLPGGYGMRVRATDPWLLNYMVHNQTPVPHNVFIEYEIDWIPVASAGATRDVRPHWIDVGSFNGFNPVYNTQRGKGELIEGECAFPKERCAEFDPYGRTDAARVGGNGVGRVVSFPAGTIVWMMGHLHPGGLRDEVELQRGSKQVPIFTSRARYFDPNGPVSWDMAMEVTPPEFRARVSAGDRLVLNSVYETERASWYEGMGIVITFVDEGTVTGPFAGPDPFTTSLDPDVGIITHGHLPEADNHGGPDRGALGEPVRVRTNRVAIGGFAYAPGNLVGDTPVVPVVSRGATLQFDNLDAVAQIYHTVTACRAPCNGSTGISYPLANGGVDFDSLELGVGVPGATAAANTITYRLPTDQFGKGLYTYFCRVHPFMRGAFEVE